MQKYILLFHIFFIVVVPSTLVVGYSKELHSRTEDHMIVTWWSHGGHMTAYNYHMMSHDLK